MPSTAPRLQVAYYYDSVGNFLGADPDAIYGQLGKHHAHSQELAQRSAWLEQIRILQQGLQSVPEAWIAFEFAIPRMGKRADVIIILAEIIFVIEFKIDAGAFTNAATEQAIDYASDLKDFHETSYGRIIIPVVIATECTPKAGAAFPLPRPSRGTDFFKWSGPRQISPIGCSSFWNAIATDGRAMDIWWL